MAFKRVYPHVTAITDWPTQQSVRLLWDRIFAVEDKIAAQATQLETVGGEITMLDQNIQDVYELAQSAEASAESLRQQVAADEGKGESTIPDYSDIANAVYARFNHIVPYADREDGKAQLTRAIAWEIYNTVDTNMGLLEKTGGTAVNGRSTDIVVQMTDGSYADVASESDNHDGTATIHVGWGRKAPDSNTSDESRWIVPTAAIAAESGPMGPA